LLASDRRRLLHGVGTQERAVHEHVAHENEMWIGAFNFFIGLQSLYTVLLKLLYYYYDYYYYYYY